MGSFPAIEYLYCQFIPPYKTILANFTHKCWFPLRYPKAKLSGRKHNVNKELNKTQKIIAVIIIQATTATIRGVSKISPLRFYKLGEGFRDFAFLLFVCSSVLVLSLHFVVVFCCPLQGYSVIEDLRGSCDPGFRFWPLLGCSGQITITFNHKSGEWFNLEFSA